MSGYGRYNQEELEVQYSLRNQQPEYEVTFIPGWVDKSAQYRDAAGGKYDLAYGDGERDRADFFPASHPNGGLLLYIHGGYWQRGDKSVYSFLAKPYNDAGYAVIAINYMMCPNVKMAEIPPQCRRAVAWAWRNCTEFGASQDKFYVMGHSAGGHLTAWMMATDWPSLDPALPKDMIKAAAPLSGLYDLEPVRHTSENRGVGSNVGFGLNIESAAEARAISLMDHPPETDAPQLVAWGLNEPDEFRRHSEEHYARLRSANDRVEALQIPGRDHFTMVDEIGDEKGELVPAILALLEK